MTRPSPYPLQLEGELDPRLSRWLWLVKWWLLALPHYLVVSIFAGGAWAGLNAANDDWAWTSGGGLTGLLVFIAGVVLLFTGRYPRPIFDFVMGMNRWCFRVAAYAALMTDRYTPFQFDMAPTNRCPTWTRPTSRDRGRPVGSRDARARALPGRLAAVGEGAVICDPAEDPDMKFYPRKGRVLSPGEATNPDYEPACTSGARPI